MKTLTYLFVFALFWAVRPQAVRFYVIRQWKYLNFTWPDEDSLKTATEKGLYVPENNVIAGVKYHDDHFYITLPRMKSGVPATLTRIRAGPLHLNVASPDLEPFPSWEMNSGDDCNSLQNVQNVEIDAKGQIWIIDGGRVQTLMDPIVKCAPKLVVYDINAKRVTTAYHFPEEVAPRNGSFLYDLVVDDTDGGYAYITDNSAHDPGIIVFSVKENRSWKIRNNRTMAADPSAVEFSVNDVPIHAPINIAGIALGPKVHTSNEKVVVNEDREVYFCPLSSHHLYSINTTILRNEHLAQTSDHDASIKDVGLKSSQTVGMTMNNQGILYYNLLGNNAIGRWDSHTPFQSGQRLIARDPKYLEWPNSFTFDGNGNLTVLTNRLNRFIFGKVDLNEYNFRLISSFVGGKSYLLDDHFNYDSHGGSTEPSPSPEPAPHEPLPSPEPKPEPGPANHEHEHHHEHGHQHEHEHDQTPPAGRDDVTVTHGSATTFAVTASLLCLTIIAVFV